MELTDPAAAIKEYTALLKKDKLNIHAYNRLMILYRRQKEYGKEVALIKTAIEAYDAYYTKHQTSHSSKVASLSKALAISTGMATKKGKSLYEPEPIAGWRKRLGVVMKKVKG